MIFLSLEDEGGLLILRVRSSGVFFIIILLFSIFLPLKDNWLLSVFDTHRLKKQQRMADPNLFLGWGLTSGQWLANIGNYHKGIKNPLLYFNYKV